MRFLHTGDWHVGKALRGRSRADEHRAVLAEVASVAEAEQVDAVLVAGDLFDTAAPSAESEQIVYEALLALARTGAHVVVVSGNHDNERRLQAVAPLLELGRVTVAASFRRPDDGGVIEVPSRDGAERARVALLPFLSQRWVVRADELMATAADQQAQAYGERMRLLIQALTAGFQRRRGERRRRPPLRDGRGARRRRAGGPDDPGLRGVGHRLPGQRAVRGPGPPAPQPGDRRSVPHPLRRLAAAARLRRDRRPQVGAGGRGPPGPAGRAPRAPALRRPPAPHAGGHAGGGAGPGRDHRGRLPPRPPAGSAAGRAGRGRAGVLRRLRRRPGAAARPAGRRGRRSGRCDRRRESTATVANPRRCSGSTWRPRGARSTRRWPGSSRSWSRSARREARAAGAGGLHRLPGADRGRLRRRRPVRAHGADRGGQVQRHRRHDLRPVRDRPPLRRRSAGRRGRVAGADGVPGPPRLRRR